MYFILNIVFVILSVILIALTFVFRKKSNFYVDEMGSWLKEIVFKEYKWIILSFLLLTFLTSILKINTLPYGLHVDEAGLAYDALSIAKYGVDRYLRSYPIWLNNYYGSQSSMYAYILVFLFKLMGYNKILLRLPAVLFRLIIFGMFVWVLKDEKSIFKSILFAFIFAICPYFIINSRWALDCNLLVGFLSISECLLIKSMKKDSLKLFILSGIFFGLSLYTYALAFIIVPLILLFNCIYLLYIKEINFKKMVLFGLPIFLLAIPLILMVLINSGVINEINGFITIPKLVGYRGSDLMLPNIENYYVIRSIFSCDKNSALGSVYLYNSTAEFGTIYYMNIPFFIYGFVMGIKKLIDSIKEKEFDINAIFVFWFLSVLFCMFMVKLPTIHRSNAIFAPMVYFVAMGIYYSTKKVKGIIIPIVLLLSLNFCFFMSYYIINYNKSLEENFLFATTYLKALDYVKELKRDDAYFDQLLTSQQFIYVLLDYEVSPYEYDTEEIVGKSEDGTVIKYHFTDNSRWDTLDLDSVYVTGPGDDMLAMFTDAGFSHKQFGIYRVFYGE